VATVEDFLRQFPDLRIVNVDYTVAREAARVRALTGLPTPDSLVLSTAIIANADTVVGNGERWRTALEKIGGCLALCLLADHA